MMGARTPFDEECAQQHGPELAAVVDAIDEASSPYVEWLCGPRSDPLPEPLPEPYNGEPF
jgi:hypothetical protein